MSDEQQPAKRFRLAGEVYEFATASDVTLRDLLILESETTALDHKIDLGEMNRLAEAFRQMTPEEQKFAPDSGWMLGVTVWMAMVKKRRDLGDLTPVKFIEAVDFSITDFAPIRDAGDHASPGKAKKRQSAKGSRPAAESRGAASS